MFMARGSFAVISLLTGLLLQPAMSHSAAPDATPTPAAPAKAKAAAYDQLPLGFEANRGQSDPSVRFLSHGPRYSVFLTDTAAVLSLSKPATANRAGVQGPTLTDTVAMELVHARPAHGIAGEDQLPGIVNYFHGNDPAQWRTGIPTYSRVEYSQVYDGIDLVYYGNRHQLEYDFRVAAGADPAKIQLHFSGAKGLRLTKEGDLEIEGQNGQIAFRRPEIYQELGGKRVPIAGRFRIVGAEKVGFQIGAYDASQTLVIDPLLSYSTYLGGSKSDGANAIAVDATGDAYVAGYANSTDFPATGGAKQTTNAGAANSVSNAFVAKLNSTGTALVYATYLGGSGAISIFGQVGDVATGIAVDSSGNAYVTGSANSTNFPVSMGAIQPSNHASNGNTGNGFVAKLNSTGTALLYSTYLGGSGFDVYSGYQGNGFQYPESDGAAGIAVDSAGDAYVTGVTYSYDFPTTLGAYLTALPGGASEIGIGSAFVTEVNPTGTNLVYSTYLGGSGFIPYDCGPEGLNNVDCPNTPGLGDAGTAIAVDAAGHAYVTGFTNSGNFPMTAGAYQTGAKSSAPEAFVTELNPAGSALVYSTYLGGSGYVNANFSCNPIGDDCTTMYTVFGDSGNAIALDAAGDVYVTGSTVSSDFPVTAGVFQSASLQPSQTVTTAFVSKLNPSGSALLYSTYLGGSGVNGDNSYAIGVDAVGNASVAGATSSTDFPVTAGSYQALNICQCRSFFTRLTPTASALVYSTYLGGTGGDTATSLALDSSANPYIAGRTYSTNFPVTSPTYQSKNHAAANNGTNAFVTMLDLSTLPNVPMVRTTTQLVASANPQVQGQAVMFTATVSANSGGVVPTGKVAFTADGILQATVALSATGQAVFTAPKLVTGNHSIVATYSGGASFLRSAASLTESISQPLTATPAFSLAAGSYVGTQKVTVTDATSGATIYYTTNAAVPTTSSTVYSGPVTIGQSETLKAIAVASGHVASAVMAAQYILSPPAPQFSPGAGTYTREEVVTISDSLPMTTLYYTTDGTTPTTASTVYSGPVPVAFDQTLKAIATRANWANSAVGTASYSITGALVPNVISTIAGNGTQGYAGDGGPALQAEFAFLAGLAYDAAGNLYIADSANEVVRKVTPAGIVSTFAGNGTAGHAGDGGSAAQAQLYYPLGVAVDAAGDVFIADSLNNAIRKVTPSGIISTVAGNFNEGYTGDGGAATKATLRGPSAVAVSATGSLFIADTFNHAIRKVYPNGEIITYAGTGKQGYTGNGGAANRATLYLPAGVALDAAGNLYIADTSNCAIRKVSPALVITTIAGYSNSSGTVFCSDTGDGGPGVNATFNFPTGVVSDAAGNLFVADPVDNVVRAVSAKGVVTTIAGNGVGGFAGDGDEALSAELELYVEQQANGLALDAMGNLAIGDGGNERVRKVTFVPQTAAPAFSLAAGTYSGAQTVTLTDATKNATIYYTTDGSVPTPSSTKYAGSLSVSKTETLRAVAVSAGAAQSDVSMAAYTIQ